MKMTLGEVVHKYRKDHAMSMRDFAKVSGLSNGYISMLEKNLNPISNGPITPSIDTYKRVAKGMGKSVDEVLALVNGENIPTEKTNTQPIDLKDILRNGTVLFDGVQHSISKEDGDMLAKIFLTVLEKEKK